MSKQAPLPPLATRSGKACMDMRARRVISQARPRIEENRRAMRRDPSERLFNDRKVLNPCLRPRHASKIKGGMC